MCRIQSASFAGWRISKHIPFALISACLFACQTMTGINHEYPVSWPPLVSSEGCPNISGDFLNLGVGKYESSPHEHYLSFHLFQRRLFDNETSGMEPLAPEDATIQYISVNNIGSQQLLIGSIDSHGVLEQRTLNIREEDYICKAGILWVDSGIEVYTGELGSYRSHYKLGLKLAEDGSLIGQLHNDNVALAMWIIPMGGTQILWFRWPVHTSASQ